MEIFEIELNLLEHDVVKDHVISGLNILPAAAYIELVLANFEHWKSECGIRLKRIKFSTPMVFQNSSKKKIHITYENSGSYYKFQILSLDEDGNWIQHAQGQVEEAKTEDTSSNNYFSHTKKDGMHLDKEEVYGMYQEAGLSYGSSFQCIKDIWIHEKQVYANLWIQPDEVKKNGTYLVHPAILDSAFQASAMPAFYEKGDKIFLPYYIEELTYRKPFEKLCVCTSNQRVTNMEQSPIKRYDISICNSKGDNCVFIKGLTIKSIDKPKNNSQLENESQTIDNNDASEISKKVIEVLSIVLNIDKSEFDKNAVFGDYGVDSIIVEELVTKLNKEFGVEMDGAILFDYPNIEALSIYLASISNSSVETVSKEGAYDFSNSESSHVEAAEWEVLSENDISMEAVQRGETEDGENAYDIAVIGLAGRFPEAENENEFFDLLCKGYSAIKEIPKERWDIETFYSKDSDAPGKTDCRYGSFLKDIEEFDPTFFGISVNKAPMMDPQQRLMLEVAWKAVEDAGYSNKKLAKTRTGVYIGICNNEYVHIGEKDYEKLSPHLAAGNAFSIVANRISYVLDVNGPSMAIDSACSSSMVALHNACKDMMTGECEMALVGGVNLTLAPENHIIFSKARLLSTDGKVRSFDERANGYIRGEGVGAILLKPVAKALEDGDNIHAVIKSTSIMHAGKSNGLNTPNPTSQKKTIQEAYTKSGISMESISYIETHGSGTEFGDYSEFRAMSEAFKQMTNKKQFCAIATVKANIGHAEAAAGILAIIKVILSLKRQKIPPLINFEKKNKKIDMVNSPFYINSKLSNWIPNGKTRRAGINCFGFGGTYAHVILEEYNNRVTDRKSGEDKGYLLTISSKNKDTLLEMTSHIKGFIDKKGEETNLSNLCYTLSCRREHYNYRIAIECETLNELKEKLKELSEKGVDSKEIFYGCKGNGRANQVLVFNNIHSHRKDIINYYNNFLLYRKKFQGLVQQLTSNYKEAIKKCVESPNQDLKISEEEEWVLGIIHNYSLFLSLKQMGIQVNGVYGIGKNNVISSLLLAGAINFDDLNLFYADKMPTVNLSSCTNDLLDWVKNGIKTRDNEDLSNISINRLIEYWNEDILSQYVKQQPKLKILKGNTMRNFTELRKAIAEHYVKGSNINWTSYYFGEHHKIVSAPGYVFSHKKYWHV